LGFRAGLARPLQLNLLLFDLGMMGLNFPVAKLQDQSRQLLEVSQLVSVGPLQRLKLGLEG
jgi:hypothetical protein